MSIRTDLALAYQMGYDDALGRRRPEPRKAEDMADGIAAENERLKAENAKLRDGFHAMQQLYEDELKHSLAENAKLRAERDEWHRVAASKQDIIDHMRDARAENAKLWELAKAFYWCTENFDTPSKCDGCPLEQSDKLTPECEVRMRELKVEDE